jgi:hypothetical protein
MTTIALQWKGIARRVHEMEAVGELLVELGVPSRTSDATTAWLRDLRDGTR